MHGTLPSINKVATLHWNLLPKVNFDHQINTLHIKYRQRPSCSLDVCAYLLEQTKTGMYKQSIDIARVRRYVEWGKKKKKKKKILYVKSNLQMSFTCPRLLSTDDGVEICYKKKKKKNPLDNCLIDIILAGAELLSVHQD